MLNRIVLLLLILLDFQYTIHAQNTATFEQQVDAICQSFNDSTQPGVSIAYLEKGKLVFSKSYGMANLEHRIPISDSSVFSLASVAKQFTIFAILLLEEKGQLSLDDTITKHLPDFSAYGNEITIRMLANHTSGIRGYFGLLGMIGMTPDHRITANDIQQLIYQQQAADFPAGSQFSYSNSGYFLLAQIVEQVSGKSFSAFMQEEVFEPLEMHHSFVRDDYYKIVKNRASAYYMDEDRALNAPTTYSHYGASNLFTTISDLMKWTLNFEQLKVGSRSIITKMNTLSQLADGTEITYALGQFRGKYHGLDHIYHSGGEAGYRSFLGRFPTKNTAILLLGNNGNINVQEMALQVADVFLKPYYKKEVKIVMKQNGQLMKGLAGAELTKFEGSFLHPESYVARNIFVRNDTLIYSRAEQNNRETPLFPLTKNTFQLGDNRHIKVVFGGESYQQLTVLENEQVIESYESYVPKTYAIEELEPFEGIFYSEELGTRYQVSMEENHLVVKHLKMNTIVLKPVQTDTFVTTTWQFRSLVFERTIEGKIKGFYISGDRAKEVRFERLDK